MKFLTSPYDRHHRPRALRLIHSPHRAGPAASLNQLPAFKARCELSFLA